MPQTYADISVYEVLVVNKSNFEHQTAKIKIKAIKNSIKHDYVKKDRGK